MISFDPALAVGRHYSWVDDVQRNPGRGAEWLCSIPFQSGGWNHRLCL